MRGESEMNSKNPHLVCNNYEHLIFAFLDDKDAEIEQLEDGTRKKHMLDPRIQHFAFYNDNTIPTEVRQDLQRMCFSAPHVIQKTKEEDVVINEYEKGPFFAEHIVSN